MTAAWVDRAYWMPEGDIQSSSKYFPYVLFSN